MTRPRSLSYAVRIADPTTITPGQPFDVIDCNSWQDAVNRYNEARQRGQFAEIVRKGPGGSLEAFDLSGSTRRLGQRSDSGVELLGRFFTGD